MAVQQEVANLVLLQADVLLCLFEPEIVRLVLLTTCCVSQYVEKQMLLHYSYADIMKNIYLEKKLKSIKF